MFARTTFLVFLVTSAANAFVVVPSTSELLRTTTGLSATTSRRDMFAGAAALLGAAVLSAPSPAQATYSGYSAREKDWDERLTKGEVKISSARSLRKQLQDMVPENDEGKSKLFCPNGASSAVSPLMENRCSDVLMATPSVYGRTQDTVGNSIPGFTGGYTAGSSTSTLTANPNVGGFPKYK
jgi:hypothetical protein